ncbi:MAG: dTDP-4-dehydrorhamnose 3,5-epimerase [Bacteroidia bacterium]|nr:dTDP-4-dehydrorhamnose 3,5-epimerase [Bacteroidia bacterium]
MFHKLSTNIPGLWLIEPDVFGDDRGWFKELFNKQSFEKIGLDHLLFVQDNLSRSSRGTLRGMHFQAPPYTQGKLVTVLEGQVLDMVVDIRVGSPTYGQHYAVELDASKHQMLFVPKGLAHGFQVLSETCLFFYKCTDTYHPETEGGLAWDDPALNLPWQDIPPLLSKKDLDYAPFGELISPFVWNQEMV